MRAVAVIGCPLCAQRYFQDRWKGFELYSGLQTSRKHHRPNVEVGEEEEDAQLSFEKSFALAWCEPLVLDPVRSPFKVFTNMPKEQKLNQLKASWEKGLILPEASGRVMKWLIEQNFEIVHLEHSRRKLTTLLEEGYYGVELSYGAALHVAELTLDCPEGARNFCRAIKAAGFAEPVALEDAMGVRSCLGKKNRSESKQRFKVDGAAVSRHLGKVTCLPIVAAVPSNQAVGTLAYLRKACASRAQSVLSIEVVERAFYELRISIKVALFLVAWLAWMEGRWQSALTEPGASSALMTDLPERNLLSTLWWLPATTPRTRKASLPPSG